MANGTTTSYNYDANGNLTSKTTGTSTVRYYWDDEDKMTKLQDSVEMNFKTDGLGFRRYKEVVGQSVTYFVYDLAESETPGLAPLVAEYDGNGNLVAKYHHDGGGLLAMTRGNQNYWHVFEAIGTVRQLVNAQTQVTDAYAFDAWGNELAMQGSTINPHRYVGKHGYYLDTQSALMLLGVRYYSAANGLFLSRDLIESYGYTYAADNPLRWIDPQGLQNWTICYPGNPQCDGTEQLTYGIVNGERVWATLRVDKFQGKLSDREKQCLKLSPGLCFWCLYNHYRTPDQIGHVMCPQKHVIRPSVYVGQV